MGKPADVGRSVYPFVIPDRNLDDSEIQLGSAEKQVEVAEGIKLAKISRGPGQSADSRSDKVLWYRKAYL